MKEKIFQVDFNPWHYLCNMSCCYCIKHLPFYREDNDVYVQKGTRTEYVKLGSIDSMMLRAKKCLAKLFEKYDVTVLTFSGSETFLFPEIIDVIQFAARYVDQVQLITNGTLLNQDLINNLGLLEGNIHISLSLDGDTYETNFARTLDDMDSFDRVIKSLQMLVKSSIKFDILMVLSQFNAEYIMDILKRLAHTYPGLGLQIWPVFGSNGIGLSSNDARYIDEIYAQYYSLDLRLQPREYFRAMRDYIISGQRKQKCYLAKYCFYLNDIGDMKICPCNGLLKQENLLSGITYPVSKDMFYGQNTLTRVPCSACFINWDVINMLLRGEVKICELGNMPFYSDEKVRDELKCLVDRFEKENRDG